MISIVSSSIAIHKFSFYLSPNPVSFVDSFILVIPVATRNYNLTKFLSLFFPPPFLVHLSQGWLAIGGKKTMKSLLSCCKLYISESRNQMSLESMERAVKLFPEVMVVNKFKDDAYNRVGYTLVSHLPVEAAADANPLRNAVFEMVKEAFRTINLQAHSGTHPRLGVVDHICFHPLSLVSLDQVASVAKSVAVDIGQNLEGGQHPI